MNRHASMLWHVIAITVYVYRCPDCQRETAIRANAFRGRTPVPGIGAVVCGGPILGFAPTYRGEAK